MGVGIRSWLACNLPDLFRVLPGPVRRTIVFKHLGPACGTALQGRVEGCFPTLMGWSIASAEPFAEGKQRDSAVKLMLRGPNGELREHVTSHIIAGTGYRVDLARLRFLSGKIRVQIKLERNGAASLNRYFESTVRGLYFVGPASAANFGPLQRFAAGATYAASRVTAHVRQDLLRFPNRNIQAVALPSLTQR